MLWMHLIFIILLSGLVKEIARAIPQHNAESPEKNHEKNRKSHEKSCGKISRKNFDIEQ